MQANVAQGSVQDQNSGIQLEMVEAKVLELVVLGQMEIVPNASFVGNLVTLCGNVTTGLTKIFHK